LTRFHYLNPQRQVTMNQAVAPINIRKRR